MHARPHLDAARVVDLILGAGFALVALAAYLASGRPGAAIATAHSAAARMGWHATYEEGLLIGLAVAALLVAVAASAVAVIYRRTPRRMP